jgi:hypothetical protein
MFHIRRIQSTALASAALCCFAVALRGAAPDVKYAATGVFATPAVSGKDGFLLAGQPFALTLVVNEATKPARRSETVAEYSNVTVTFTVKSGTDGFTYTFTTLPDVTLFLVVGGPGKPDWFALTIPFDYGGLNMTVTAKVRMPAGTITTRAIRPFTAPVSLTPSDGTVTYACPACAPPYTGNSTTLAFAGGTFSGYKQ